jgi:hypothetical protein
MVVSGGARSRGLKCFDASRWRLPKVEVELAGCGVNGGSEAKQEMRV